MNADDAWEKITAGASLVQAYSGFVFEGPSLGSSVVKGLDKKLRQHGLSSIEEGWNHAQEGAINVHTSAKIVNYWRFADFNCIRGNYTIA